MLRRILSLFFVLAILSVVPRLPAQGPQTAPEPQLNTPPVRPRDPSEVFRDEQLRRMARERNAGRQKQLKKDTEDLLKLATELKEYVDKTNENVLSINVIRKAEEIEKLAHSVKTKMRDSN